MENGKWKMENKGGAGRGWTLTVRENGLPFTDDLLPQQIWSVPRFVIHCGVWHFLSCCRLWRWARLGERRRRNPAR